MNRITLRYFAVLRERRGTDSEVLMVEEGSTLSEIYTQLFPPGPEGALPIAFALNQEYATGEAVAKNGDEVVFLPPLGGG